MNRSAGLLIYRERNGRPEVLLVHPGGPFWAKKDIASWSIPKGEFEEGEDPLETAIREFSEETGLEVPKGHPVPLRPVKQSNRKVIHAWYLKGDVDASIVRSNMFEVEWPPKSGKTQQFPEVDRAAWYSLSEAKAKVHAGQVPIIEQLEHALGVLPAAPADDPESLQDPL